MIKHIVLAAGAYKGLYILGALNYLTSIGYYDIENIETIYGGSVGGLIGAMLCLKIDWTDMIKYIIERPWNKVIKFDSNIIFSMVTSKGLFDENIFKIFFKNLLESKGLTVDVTLKELYDFSNIELYLHAVSVNTLEIRKLSYKTDPDMKLLDAIYASCCMPFIFQPKILDGMYYIDGAVKNVYPMDFCIKDNKKQEEILGIKIRDLTKKNSITVGDNLFSYGYYLFNSLICEYRTKYDINIRNQIIIPAKQSTIETAISIVSEKKTRQAFLELGERYAKLFFEYEKNKQ